MTTNDIMEEISKKYVEIVANRTGYFNCIQRDYGTDLSIRKAVMCPKRKRLLTQAKTVDIQLKAVSEKYIRGLSDPAKTIIKYDLEVKNYNDLSERSAESAYTSLLLIVFIIPDDQNHWVSITPNELIVKKCAYWYKVPENASLSTNKETVTIDIPKSNQVGLSLFNDLFSSF
jgi:hypothetical protein